MTCAEVTRLLSEGTPIVELKRTTSFSDHLRNCARCEELLRWVESPVPDSGLGSEAADRVRTLIHADLKPVRPLPSTPVVVIGAIALASAIAGLHMLTMGARGWLTLSPVQSLSLGFLFASTVILAALSLNATLRPAARAVVPALAPLLLLPLGFASLAVFLFTAHPQEHFFADGIRCLSGGFMIALLTSAMTFAFARRGYPLNWSLTGALIGALGGTVALLALQISCPEHESGHLLVFHGLAMLVSIAAGYSAGRRAAA
ncbi:MAG TPA: hypothetical protein DEH78_05125 [Solibacterales bacterium]|nr:hypothetical protein [Bryobacterales bacterium]